MYLKTTTTLTRLRSNAVMREPSFCISRLLRAYTCGDPGQTTRMQMLVEPRILVG